MKEWKSEKREKRERDLKGEKQKAVKRREVKVCERSSSRERGREKRMGSVTVFIIVRERKAIEDLITTHTNLAKHCFQKKRKQR